MSKELGELFYKEKRDQNHKTLDKYRQGNNALQERFILPNHAINIHSAQPFRKLLPTS